MISEEVYWHTLLWWRILDRIRQRLIGRAIPRVTERATETEAHPSNLDTEPA